LLVNVDSNGDPIGFGSGFVIADDIVVTNAHVVKDGDYVLAKLVSEEKSFTEARSLLAYSEKYDLAVLSIDGLGAQPVEFGDSNALRIGDSVYAIGNPQGLTGTFSIGNVSAKRKIEGVTYIQMTAPISPGSSGGPVVDANGRLVAVAVAGHKEGGNLNFAVPVSYLTPLLEKANIKISSKTEKNIKNQLQQIRDQLQQSAQIQPQNEPKIGRNTTLKKWFGKSKRVNTLESERASPLTKGPLKKDKEQRKPLIIGDTRTDIYYWPWCSGYQEVPPERRIKFRSSSQAEQTGFKESHSCPKIGILTN